MPYLSFSLINIRNASTSIWENTISAARDNDEHSILWQKQTQTQGTPGPIAPFHSTRKPTNPDGKIPSPPVLQGMGKRFPRTPLTF